MSSRARIVLVGAGMWSQGWHLPHLHRNSKAEIAAIIDSNFHPKSPLNPQMQSLSELAKIYKCPTFSTLSD